tara:strand:+ start:882 stop:1013 length:132 start_codon:yes stop_codon:yes gene_type:complete
MLTVEELLKSLSKFKEYEERGLIPKDLKSFKDQSDWIKHQKQA